jgi:RNA polymerase sigma factor (sigma-70 family)
MPETKWRQTVASIRELVLAGDTAGIDDATLLKLFVSNRDGAAFDAIVRRHGPLVYGVCLRVLQNASDAEDAFQATFLVLVRKATTLKQPELLGSWLHGVAFQTARSARATARRHRRLESQLIPREPQSAPTNFNDLSAVLDEELERLPAKYRIPIVLCELQEKSRKHAAAVLGVPEGTISSRLARGKALMAERLTRRNITLGSAAVAASLASTSVAPSAALVQLTVRAGTAALATQSAAVGVASAKAIQLSETVIKMMFASKLKLTSLCIAGGVLLMTGAGLLTAQSRRGSAVITSTASAADDQQKSTAPPAPQSALFRATLDAATEIDDLQERLTLLLSLADAQLKAGDRPGALAALANALPLVRGMEESTKKAQLLGDVARMLVVAGERAQGAQIAKDVEKMALASSNPHSLNTGLAIAINLWTSWDDFDAGLALIQRNPKQAGVLIRAMIRAIQPKRGNELAAHAALEKLVQIVSKWPNDGKRDPAHDDPQQQMVNGFYRAILPNDVMRLEVLDFIAIALARTGYAEDARRLYQSNRAEGVNRTMGTGISPLLEMAEGLAQADKIPEALQIAGQIPNESTQRLDAAYAIALKQVRLGDFTAALKTISDSSSIPQKSGVQRNFTDENKSATLRRKSIVRANVLRAIGLAQLDKGNRKAAFEALDALRRWNVEDAADGEEPGVMPVDRFPFLEAVDLEFLREISYTPPVHSRSTKLSSRVAQVDLEAALGEFPAARKTAGNLTSASEKAKAFLFLGKHLLAAGKKSEAIQALSRASRSAERIPALVNSARRGNFGGRGQAGLEEMVANMNKHLLLNQIAGLQAQAGDEEGAFETAESFKSQANLDALVVDLAKSGDGEAAINSLDKLVSTESKARALEGIARVMCKQGEEKAAAALVSKQKNPLLRAYTLLGMAVGSGTSAK